MPIDRFRLPFGAVATRLATGEAVRASCAIPGVFVPAVVDGQELVDGGLISPLPVEQARQLGADVVIAVFSRTDFGVRKEMIQAGYEAGRKALAEHKRRIPRA